MSLNPFMAIASHHPFTSAPPVTDGDADPTTGGFSYRLIKSGPDVNPDDVEVAHVQSIEVMVMWGTNVLHMASLRGMQGFSVGEDPAPHCDFFLPSEVLGTTRAPIVTKAGALVILPRTTGWAELPGQGRRALEDLVRSGVARPSDELSGAYELSIPTGGKAHMDLPEGIAFQVSVGNAGKAPPVGAFSSVEPGSYLFSGLSFLLHVGVLASLAFFMPSLGADDSESIGRDQILKMQHFLQASAERENEQRDVPVIQDNADNKEGGSGKAAKGEEGSMGTPNTNHTGMRYGVQGPRDNPDPHIARQAALREAAEFGMIGLLNAGGGADPNAPTAPWGREDSLGNDPMSAHGNMWGDAIGDSLGVGGLGLMGTGEGGGGSGEGIGIGDIGTIGRGHGTGDGSGFGRGHGGLGGHHVVHAPTMRQGPLTANGHLPPEVIQRIVRQNFGRFKLCYTEGLRQNPSLNGRVAVKFVIGRDGSVTTSADGGSDLADRSVTQCVIRGFGNLSFPSPDGGIVTVVYPLIFSPSDE